MEDYKEVEVVAKLVDDSEQPQEGIIEEVTEVVNDGEEFPVELQEENIEPSKMNNKQAVFNYIAVIIKNIKKDDLNVSLFDIVNSISVDRMVKNLKELQGIDIPYKVANKHYKLARKKVKGL